MIVVMASRRLASHSQKVLLGLGQSVSIIDYHINSAQVKALQQSPWVRDGPTFQRLSRHAAHASAGATVLRDFACGPEEKGPPLLKQGWQMLTDVLSGVARGHAL